MNGWTVVRIITFCCGFHYISEKTARIKDYLPEYEENPEELKREAPVLIYNHVSYLDVIYLIHSKFAPSFISKIDVKNYIMIGSICSGLQSIYVKRDIKNDRDNVLEMMRERYSLYKIVELKTRRRMIDILWLPLPQKEPLPMENNYFHSKREHLWIWIQSRWSVWIINLDISDLLWEKWIW